MQNELAQLGEVFRARREERGLSLKEVENSTSIRQSYLEAIENGHLGKLISPVYAQGFIKKYASLLELDGEQLLQSYPYVRQILNDKNYQPQEELSFGISSLEVRGSPGGEVKWLPNLMWVGLSVVGLLSLWFLARYIGLF